MKEWFKARNVWGAAILSLSDEDAGRLAKAIWSYTMNGEIMQIEGAGQGVLAMAIMTLGQDEERESEISEKRAIVGSLGGKQKQANAIKLRQTIANGSNCYQSIANVANANNKNKNQNKREEKEPESESFMDADDAQAIQSDHNRILDAAEDAGFKMSNDVRATLIALYADNGLNKMLEAMKSCVDHGAPNLAYLKAVLKGDGKKPEKPQRQAKVVIAQQYTQRPFINEQEEAERRFIEEAKKAMGTG